MAKSEERLKALELRRTGESVKGIAKKLGVSSSTVSIWTHDVPLTARQRKTLRAQQIAAGHRGRMMGVDTNKRKKQERITLAETEAATRIQVLSKNELFYTGLGLYWGEGVKASRSSLALVNSDPRVVVLMMRWFSECWDVEKTRFQPRVFISDLHRDREEVITRFWIKTLRLPRSQFRRMIFLDKGKKIYENRDVYYGVLALRVSKGGDLKYKILACINQIAKVANMPG